jgi:hypothetical protein
MYTKYGYVLEVVESNCGKGRSKCTVCGKILTNTEKNIANYRDLNKAHIAAAGLQNEVQFLNRALTVGGEQHRKITVDTLLLAYFTYKEKLPFTLPSRLQPVLELF